MREKRSHSSKPVQEKRNMATRRTYLCFPALAVVLALAGTAQSQGAKCPDNPPPNINSPQAPEDVCIPDGFGGNPIRYFDDFSWRSFIAMVWPSKSGQRGQPDTNLRPGDPTRPTVFESLKADWEIFQPRGATPSPWESFAGTRPCKEGKPDDLFLASFHEFGNIGQAGKGRFVNPLVAQNQTYVRYLGGFDQIEFQKILDESLYLKSELKKRMPIVFPNGALDVKSAWMDMTGIDAERRKRFYTREAWVQLPGSVGVCEKKTVGLVGLHIVVKTRSRPQWIWVTFEQVDNVPPKPGDKLKTSFNDGNGQPMPDKSPYGWPPAPTAPQPVNLDRIKPIHASTQDTNRKYQAAIRAQDPNSVWQFYQLVMIQWPLQVAKPEIPGTPANTFPGQGSDQTAFANITMETWDQKDIFLGCMNCHNIANSGQSRTDFVWALWTKSFEPNVAARRLATEDPVHKLMDLLTTHQTPSGNKEE
jgi:hypothetical protein